MVKTRTLQLMAMYGGVIVLGTGIGLMEKLQYDMRHSEFYKKSFVLLRGYGPAMEMFGEPLEAKRLDLTSKGPNKLTALNAEIVVPVKGKNNQGTLYSWASRPKPTDSWEIDKLEIEVDGARRKWKFYERFSPENTENSENNDLDINVNEKEFFYLADDSR